MKISRLPRLLPLLVLAVAARADTWVSPLFSDGAVLQHGKPIPIWGSGMPGEKVTVTFAGQTAVTTVDEHWKWLLLLPPLAPSEEPRDLVIEGKNKTVVHNVLVGDVWFCAGQSNIEWPVRLSQGGPEAMAAGYPLIRHVRIPRATAGSPRDDFQAEWKAGTPDNVGNFTAVGFFFAHEIQQKLHIPIGLINCTYGGTPIESWLSPAMVEANPSSAAYLREWEKSKATWPAQVAEFEQRYRRALQAPGSAAPARPSVRPEYDTPSGAYLGMLYSCFPYGVRGVLWYQGESNAGRDAGYRSLFPLFIRSLRDLWGDDQLPFLFVQLPNWDDPNDATHQTWALLRDAQASALSVPHTGMAVTIDVGDAANLHPTNKPPVGHRLAVLAERGVYGLDVEDRGPKAESASRDGASVKVQFSHCRGGLVLKGDTAGAFELAGADGVFHPADVKAAGDGVTITSTAVPQAVSVRYAWSNSPKAPLYNQDGLPAAPFRLQVR